MTKANKIMAMGLLLSGFLFSGIGSSKAAPVELGKLQWGRDLGHARLCLAKAADQKYALQRTSLRLVDLSPRQALRANATIAIGNSPVQFLSPRQQTQAGLGAARETES